MEILHFVAKEDTLYGMKIATRLLISFATMGARGGGGGGQKRQENEWRNIRTAP